MQVHTKHVAMFPLDHKQDDEGYHVVVTDDDGRQFSTSAEIMTAKHKYKPYLLGKELARDGVWFELNRRQGTLHMMPIVKITL